MPTLLTQLCEEFVARVRPVLDPLDRAAQALSDAKSSAPGRQLALQLAEVRHQLALVTDKVDDQQAYVLIFGPLKSGKSTLMNTLAATYVSEVSALPAYPCLVYVSHSDDRRFTLTRYDGGVETYEDASALEVRMDKAHSDLAERIRRCEAAGITFDPQQHFPEAIRRVDVGVRAAELGKTNAVLVDTPGLYSRMKFGYDGMTKDFRSSAASAVFVVRSDNLFLDHVFDEFSRLLELFSRIFLIVNIDSNKLDLRPDGSLQPSLEQSDPQRVLQAFETLAMSAPLKAAAEAGRLRCYPVDLMRAGSRRLRGSAGSVSPSPKSATGAADDGFDAFFGDLASYLESPEYVMAFFGDSLRRAGQLLTDCKQMTDHRELAVVKKHMLEAQQQLADVHVRAESVDRCLAHDWSAAASSLRTDLGPVLARQSQSATDSVGRAQSALLRGWLETDASLRDLLKGEYVPMLIRYQEELTSTASKELSERVVQGQAGFAVHRELSQDLKKATVNLNDIGRRVHLRTDRQALIRMPPTPLRGEHLPVRRTFSDWLLLRRSRSLHERVFGSTEEPARPISPREKQVRLGGKNIEELRRRLDSYRARLQRDTAERVRASFLEDYCTAVAGEVEQQLSARREQLRDQAKQLQQRIDRCEAVLAPFGEIGQCVERANEGLKQLAARFGAVKATELLAPIAGKDPVIPARPPQAPVRPGFANTPGKPLARKPAPPKPGRSPQ
ncbi:MAG: dynamin family protein [Planctomycetota bacterium]